MFDNTRQGRLRSLAGEYQRGEEKLSVVQIYATYFVSPIPEDMLEDLIIKHNVCLNNENDVFELPKHKIGPFEHIAGKIDARGGVLRDRELIYLSRPYPNKIFNARMEQYIQEVEERYLNAIKAQTDIPVSPFAERSDIASIEYDVHYYDPALFSTKDMGSMHPVTIFPGYKAVKPDQGKLVGFDKGELPYPDQSLIPFKVFLSDLTASFD